MKSEVGRWTVSVSFSTESMKGLVADGGLGARCNYLSTGEPRVKSYKVNLSHLRRPNGRCSAG